MPKIFDQYTIVIQPGVGSTVGWGPDFGDPSDDTSFIVLVNAPIIGALSLDSTLTAIGEVILSVILNATLDLTCQGEARIENLSFGYTGPWVTTAIISSAELAPDYNLLTATGLVERDISTVYDVLTSQQTVTFDITDLSYTLWTALGTISGDLSSEFTGPWTAVGTITEDLSTDYLITCQGTVVFDDADINYTGPWTAIGTITGDLHSEFTGPWTAIGTITFDIGPDYSLLTCQGTIVADTLQLDHTKTCACAPLFSAASIEFTGPHTCQGLVDELVYELDFVGAATGVNIDVLVPTGATNMFSEVWSGGGGGGTALVNGGGGGGGGGYASDTEPVTAGTTITIQVGAGGALGTAGGLSHVLEAGTTRSRATGGGAGGNGGVGGQGAAGARGDATNGDTLRDGGLGGGGGGVQLNGGGGGGGSGTNNAGGNGAANRTGGAAGSALGGLGGTGAGGVGQLSTAGSERGGGGGGASTTNPANVGAKGGVRVRFDVLTP